MSKIFKDGLKTNPNNNCVAVKAEFLKFAGGGGGGEEEAYLYHCASVT